MTFVTALDLPIEQALYALRSSIGISVFSFVSDFAGAAMVVAVCLLALWILHSGKRWEYGLGLLIAVAGSAVVGLVLKYLIARPRPPLYMHAVVETSYSFPSSHSTAAMALYGFLAFSAVHIVGRRWRIPFALLCTALILAIGFSRLYLGVHYLTDVLGGYLLGAVFVWLGVALADSFRDLIGRFRRR